MLRKISAAFSSRRTARRPRRQRLGRHARAVAPFEVQRPRRRREGRHRHHLFQHGAGPPARAPRRAARARHHEGAHAQPARHGGGGRHGRAGARAGREPFGALRLVQRPPPLLRQGGAHADGRRAPEERPPVHRRGNGGLPVSGKGDFSVVINDSGIDATHPDLQLGKNVIQNVFIATGTDTLSGFTTLQALENLPNTDLNVGHGTHCAGIVGGTGQQSGGLYAGVAPGARLIGTGSGAVLFVLNALGGFEWSFDEPVALRHPRHLELVRRLGRLRPRRPRRHRREGRARQQHHRRLRRRQLRPRPRHAQPLRQGAVGHLGRGGHEGGRARQLLLARHPEGRAPGRRGPEQRLRRADHHRAGHGARVRVERREVLGRLRLDPLEDEHLRQRPRPTTSNSRPPTSPSTRRFPAPRWRRRTSRAWSR